MIDLSVTLILPFQQTKCFIKKIKKKILQKKSRNNTDQECFWIPNYNKLVNIVKKDPGTVTIHFEKK